MMEFLDKLRTGCDVEFNEESKIFETEHDFTFHDKNHLAAEDLLSQIKEHFAVVAEQVIQLRASLRCDYFHMKFFFFPNFA